jgi:hypothetical protein
MQTDRQNGHWTQMNHGCAQFMTFMKRIQIHESLVHSEPMMRYYDSICCNHPAITVATPRLLLYCKKTGTTCSPHPRWRPTGILSLPSYLRSHHTAWPNTVQFISWYLRTFCQSSIWISTCQSFKIHPPLVHCTVQCNSKGPIPYACSATPGCTSPTWKYSLSSSKSSRSSTKGRVTCQCGTNWSL